MLPDDKPGSPPGQTPIPPPSGAHPVPACVPPLPQRQPGATNTRIFTRDASPGRHREPGRSQIRPAVDRGVGRGLTALVLALVAALTLSGCGGPAQQAVTSGRVGHTAAAGDARVLKGVCPDRVVIQAGWLPQADVGWAYRMLGSYTIDKSHKRVSGRLLAGDVDTGVTLEVRSGGPATGYVPVSALMYQDPSITFGTRPTDESIMFSARQPTLAVLAPLDGDPQILLWDPKTYPNLNSISDVGQTDTRVVYFQGNTYMDYLTGTGILRPSQVEGSYDGTPTRFVESGGKVVVQGYATNEPYLYEHEVSAWGKPVSYQLVQDTNYPDYANMLAIRSRDRERLDGCLRALVPIAQQAQVDFLTNPGSTLAEIVKIVAAFDVGFSYTAGNAAYAVDTLKKLGLVGNGTDHTLGDTRTDRLQRMIDIITPIAAGQKKLLKPGLTPADLATNQYLDPAIGLPDK